MNFNNSGDTRTRISLKRQIPLLIDTAVNWIGVSNRHRAQTQQSNREFHSSINLLPELDSFRAPASARATLFAGLFLLGGCSDSAAQYAGIWKDHCDDYWGVLMQARAEGLYAITFCGLSGCLEPGEWMPDSHIIDDPLYQVISSTQIRIKHGVQDFNTYTRCNTDATWKT